MLEKYVICTKCKKPVNTSDPKIRDSCKQCSSGEVNDGAHGDNIFCPDCQVLIDGCTVCGYHLEQYNGGLDEDQCTTGV